MRNNSKWWVGGAILFLAIFVFVYSNFAKNEQGAVTQGELAKMLGEKMDLEIQQGTGADGYIKALEQRGVKPTEGWNADKPVTREDMAFILAGVGRLQAEVAAGKDPQTVLREVGVVLPGNINRESVRDVLEEPSVKRLMEAPIPSGEVIPYPSKEIEPIGGGEGGPAPAAPIKELAPTPAPPETPPDARPSGS